MWIGTVGDGRGDSIMEREANPKRDRPIGSAGPHNELDRRALLVLGLSAAFGLASARVLPPPRLALFHFAIAGGFHHGLSQVWGRLLAGLLLELRAEPGNPHDANAVEVLMPSGSTLGGLKFGYLPRDGHAAAAAARWLARGASLRAEVLGRVGEAPGQEIPDDLVFTSFLNGDPLLRWRLRRRVSWLAAAARSAGMTVVAR